MFLKLITFFLLCSQSICYGQSVTCLELSCPKQTYCGISDTGSYRCLPCPNNLCPSPGYTYKIGDINRMLIRKKLKKIAKIVKVGLTIAAIAKTGGVAALKVAAASKAKEFAIRKGIQCVKNGLSNFCNGKKKSIGKIVGKVNSIKKTLAAKLRYKKINLGKTNKVKSTRITSKTPGKFIRANKGSKNGKRRPLNKVVTKKRRINKKGKSRPLNKVVTKKRRINKKGKRRPLNKVVTKKGSTKPTSSVTPCKTIIDNIADNVNTVTKNVAIKTVNRGRDWLKRKISLPCNKKNLRSSKKTNNPQSKTDDSITTPSPVTNMDDSMATPAPATSKDDSVHSPKKQRTRPVIPSKDDSTNSPKKKRTRPIIPSDDSTNSPKKKRTRPIIPSDDSTNSPKKKRTRPIIPSDDSTNSPTVRPIVRRQKHRPVITNTPTVPSDDSTNSPTVRRQKQRTRPTVPSDDSTNSPKKQITRLVITKKYTPTVPSDDSTNSPTALPSKAPSLVPTRIPTVSPTRIPTVSPTTIPTVLPTRSPTRNPSLRPISTPTMIPYTWSMFSSAPVVNLNIPPTLVPTVSMFNLLTNFPTTLPMKTSSIGSPTISPIRQPTLSPSPGSTTFIPTFTPSTTPAPIPTNIPSMSPTMSPTSIPTTSNIEKSSISKSTNASSNSSTTIGASVGCSILLILLILACVFLIRKQSKTPYEIWSTHYNTNNKPVDPPPIEREDIHHFYHRSPRPSVNVYPRFTPHVSGRETLRNSTVSTRYDTHQGAHRLSINMVNRNNAL